MAIDFMEPVATLDAPRQSEALYEVVYGQRVELPPISIYSSVIASELSFYLGPFVRQNRLGRVVTEGLFILDAEADLRRRPDLAFVSAATWPLDRRLPELGDWEVVPDLPIEVVSPNDLVNHLLPKVREYFQYGARRVWVVVPEERQIYSYSAPNRVRIYDATEELTDEELLPGFRLQVGSLFQPPAA